MYDITIQFKAWILIHPNQGRQQRYRSNEGQSFEHKEEEEEEHEEEKEEEEEEEEHEEEVVVEEEEEK